MLYLCMLFRQMLLLHVILNHAVSTYSDCVCYFNKCYFFVLFWFMLFQRMVLAHAISTNVISACYFNKSYFGMIFQRILFRHVSFACYFNACYFLRVLLTRVIFRRRVIARVSCDAAGRCGGETQSLARVHSASKRGPAVERKNNSPIRRISRRARSVINHNLQRSTQRLLRILQPPDPDTYITYDKFS